MWSIVEKKLCSGSMLGYMRSHSKKPSLTYMLAVMTKISWSINIGKGVMESKVQKIIWSRGTERMGISNVKA